MELKVLCEEGFEYALFGLGLSYGLVNDYDFNYFMIDKDVRDRLYKVSVKLYNKDGGHNKFLESIQAWIDIDAPLYFWTEFDTYRIGMTKQSASTMHTLLKNEITKDMFSKNISDNTLKELEDIRQSGDLMELKGALPCSFIQRRICCMNYKTLRNIYHQRKTHRLPEWQTFCQLIMKQLKHPYYIDKTE